MGSSGRTAFELAEGYHCVTKCSHVGAGMVMFVSPFSSIKFIKYSFELVQADDIDFREIQFFQHLKIPVVGHQIITASCKGSVHELVVVRVARNQVHLEIDSVGWTFGSSSRVLMTVWATSGRQCQPIFFSYSFRIELVTNKSMF